MKSIFVFAGNNKDNNYRAAYWLVGLIMIISALNLVGWQFSVHYLRQPLPQITAMNPLTAVCFITSSLSFCFFTKFSKRIASQALGYFMAAFTLVVGLLVFVDVFSSPQSDLDAFLFKDAVNENSAQPQHIVPQTAFNFVLTGLALILIGVKREGTRQAANYMAVVVAVVGLFSCMGYLYQIKEFYAYFKYVPMSLFSGICFMLIAGAILLGNAHIGFMKSLTSPHLGGVLARILIPAIVIIPLLLGYLRLYISQKYEMSAEFGVAILVTSIILILFMLVWYVSILVNRSDVLRKQAEERIVTLNKELEQKVRTKTAELAGVLERITDGFIMLDRNFCCIYANPKIGEMTGRSPQSLVGKNIWEEFPNAVGTTTYDAFHQAMNEKVYTVNRDYYQPLDLWQESHIYPSPEGLSIFVRNVGEQKKAEEKILGLNKELASLNADLEERIINRTAQLAAANSELEAFSYSISHDLRAPLRAVNGYAKMLEEDYESILNDNAKRLLGIVQQNARHMGLLIDGLLTFSRLGRTEIQKSVTDMVALTHSVVNDLSRITNHQAEIKISSLLPVAADGSLIKQVMLNFISNAVKYSSKLRHPVVEIDSVKKDEEIIYSIKDNGVGFDMKYKDKLFGVFQRLHSQDQFEGTGVGLAIAKRIVEKHDGRVWAEGEPGQGSIFYFSLPADPHKAIDSDKLIADS